MSRQLTKTPLKRVIRSFLSTVILSLLIAGCGTGGATMPIETSTTEGMQVIDENDGMQVTDTVEGMQATDTVEGMQATDTVEGMQATDTVENMLTTEEQLHSSPDEMKLTWKAALVRVPTVQGEIIETTTQALENGEVVPDSTYPVVIWMHGCNGFWGGTGFRLDWLAQNGFVVIAPLSFARSFYPESCNVQSHESGLYRPTLKMRQYDAGYAIEKVRGFAWADTDNLVIAGLSEGAAVATTYMDKDNPKGYLKARIAEAWGCHAGWPEFQGLNAPDSQAVLTLVADRDPWYQSSYHQGDCGEFMNLNNGSLSFVVDYEPLRNRHELWEDPAIQEIIRTFLLDQVERSQP